MDFEPIPRYPDTYREQEIGHICQYALSGKSLCFVGVYGIGKSSLADYLRQYQGCYRSEKSAHVLFPIVDCAGWDGTPEDLWVKMYDSFCNAIDERQQISWRALQGFPRPDGTPLHNLLEVIHHSCRLGGCKAMFVLDNFDNMVQSGPQSMLNELNILQNEGNPEHVSYLFLTQKLPHRLGGHSLTDANSDFNQFIQQNIYALTTHTYDDMRYILRHIVDRDRSGVTNRELAMIEDLGGNHASLTETVYEIWCKESPATGDILHYMAQHPDIRQECLWIFQSLHREEQEVALRLMQDNVTVTDQEIIDHLGRRGLLTYSGEVRWFSKLMDEYIAMLVN